MAVSTHRQRLRDIDNTGFGPNSSVEGGRLVNADGSTNLRKRGIPFWERISIYHSLLRMKRGMFFLVILLFYGALNLIYAMLYMAAGVEHLSGADGSGNVTDKFLEAFFFSSQTLTTVGYGRVSPMGVATNVIATTESLVGILAFALVTGIMYGRFARPRAFLIFSPNLLVAPYKGGKALMFRVATYKNNHLTDVEAMVTLGTHEQENGKTVTKFYTLKLEFPKINSLALSWTIVHPINEDSPLFHYTKEEVNTSKMEVIVVIKGFDDHFSNIVQQRTSYTYKQVIYGAKFLPMFERAANGEYTLMELNKINAHEMVQLPEHTDRV